MCINGNIVDNNFTVLREKQLVKDRCGTLDVCKFENFVYPIEQSFSPGVLSYEEIKDSCYYNEFCNVSNYPKFKTGTKVKGNSEWVIDNPNGDYCIYNEYCTYKNAPSFYTSISSYILNDTCVKYWNGECYKLAYCTFTKIQDLSTSGHTVKIIDTLGTLDSLKCESLYQFKYNECNFKFSNQFLNLYDRAKLDSILYIDNIVANVYPNPFNNEIHIEFLTNYQNDVEISLSNILGVEVIKSNKYKLEDKQKITLNVVDLPNGFYEIKIKNLNTSKVNTFKLVHYNN